MPVAQPLNLPVVASVRECSTLTSIDVSQAVGAPTRFTSAAVVDDGKLAPYCKVLVGIEPDLQFEVRLPVSGWTQRFLLGTRCENKGSEQLACLPNEQQGHLVQVFTNGVMNLRCY